MPREVFIRKVGGSWFVLYAVRPKYGRKHAASFDARDHDKAAVVKYVERKTHLKLIDDPENKVPQ